MICSEAKMDAYDVIKNVMESFNKLNKNLSIQNLYKFTSIKTKEYMGSYIRFRSIILENYTHFFNHDNWEFYGIADHVSRDGKGGPVNRLLNQKILINKNNVSYVYLIKLSIQYDFVNKQPIYDYISKQCLNKYWRIDSIELISTIPSYYENYQNNISKNINNDSLEICSKNPLTGYFRDGYCNTDENDYGTHTVCAQVTNQFLNYTKNKGNDLITPSPSNNFPGLKEGDHWCLCALRYKQAKDDGIHLQVNKKATHKKTLDYVKI